MDTLSISQTVFYIVASLAIIAVGIALLIALYYLVCILRDTRNLSEEIKHFLNKLKNRFKKTVTSISKKGIKIK